MSPITASSGLRIRYREWGEARGGEPIVLIHAAGGGSILWLDVGRRLGARRRVVAPDLPGHGQSPPSAHRISLATYRDDVGWLCSRLGIHRAALCGHSMGAAIALLAALEYPDRVSHLVLLASAARLPVAPAVLTTIRDRFAELPARWGTLAYSPTAARDDVSRWSSVAFQAPRDIVLADFVACADLDLRDRLAELSTPTLVIGAADDLITTPRAVADLAARIPGARVHTIHRAGHNVVQERPAEVGALILDFLGAANQNERPR